VIGDWRRVRRQVEALIPDTLYGSRAGTTDSEAVFLAIMGAGVERDPIAATTAILSEVAEIVKDEPLRFTAALSNGHDLYAFRFATNDKSNSLYYDASGDEVVIVSEPLDDTPNRWKAVPPGHMVVARTGRAAEIAPFAAVRQIAAE
jgi:predicted glutamine amidotransferase